MYTLLITICVSHTPQAWDRVSRRTPLRANQANMRAQHSTIGAYTYLWDVFENKRAAGEYGSHCKKSFDVFVRGLADLLHHQDSRVVNERQAARDAEDETGGAEGAGRRRSAVEALVLEGDAEQGPICRQVSHTQGKESGQEKHRPATRVAVVEPEADGVAEGDVEDQAHEDPGDDEERAVGGVLVFLEGGHRDQAAQAIPARVLLEAVGAGALVWRRNLRFARLIFVFLRTCVYTAARGLAQMNCRNGLSPKRRLCSGAWDAGALSDYFGLRVL